MTNHIKARLAHDEHAIGVWLQTGSAAIVEIGGAVNLDFVLIDCEHGPFGFDHAVGLIRAAEAAQVTSIVRVPGNGLRELGQFMDAGAGGLLVPQVGSAHQARAIASAVKYRTAAFPNGTRGACPITRATSYGSPDWPHYAQRANDNCSLWILIETPEGLNDLPRILDVPGIDGIMFGTHDLSVAMGYDGDRAHPEVLAKLDGAVEKVRERGIEVIGSLTDASPAAAAAHHAQLASQGYRIFLTASDGRVVFNAFSNLLAAVRPGG